MAGRPRTVTFFVVQIPLGSTPRAWGREFRDKFGFEYDHEPRVRTELLLWPGDVSAAVLARNLRAAGLRFRTFRGEPEKMFNVLG